MAPAVHEDVVVCWAIFAVVAILEIVLRIVVCNNTSTGSGSMRRQESNSSSRNSSPSMTEREKLFAQRRRLVQEARPLNTPSTFAQHAKLMRRIAEIDRKIEQLARNMDENAGSNGTATAVPALSQKWASRCNFANCAPIFAKVIIYIAIAYLFWEIPVAVVPRSLMLRRFRRMLPSVAETWPASMISAGAWVFVCYRGIKRCFDHLVSPSKSTQSAIAEF
jgi:hypothetical protein